MASYGNCITERNRDMIEIYSSEKISYMTVVELDGKCYPFMVISNIGTLITKHLEGTVDIKTYISVPKSDLV